MPTVATWNVNSVKARLANVTAWLEEAAPDIVVLQEIKCETDAFPREAIERLGYHAAVAGQKAYNGVALLSKRPIEAVTTVLPGEPEDEQARWIEADTFGIRICGLYLPNGNPVSTDKFAYKLRWMARLKSRAEALLAVETPFLLAGDFNVIPEPQDAHDPAAWTGDALYRPESRAAFRAILHLGLTDAYRALHPEEVAFTFWDYQGGAWQRDDGIRIDHILLSPQLADRLAACRIDRAVRGREKASDHVPVVATLR